MRVEEIADAGAGLLYFLLHECHKQYLINNAFYIYYI